MCRQRSVTRVAVFVCGQGLRGETTTDAVEIMVSAFDVISLFIAIPVDRALACEQIQCFTFSNNYFTYKGKTYKGNSRLIEALSVSW